MPLNIKTRYPDDKERIFEYLDKKRCTQILKHTKELYTWMKKQLEQ